MTTVTILPEAASLDHIEYRAIAGRRQARAGSPGAALDALSKQLSPEEAGTLVIVQSHQPDQFFTAPETRRLHELLSLWRNAREAGGALTPDQAAELETLVDAEVRASGERAAAILAGLGE